jgi:hypothetical protein
MALPFVFAFPSLSSSTVTSLSIACSVAYKYVVDNWFDDEDKLPDYSSSTPTYSPTSFKDRRSSTVKDDFIKSKNESDKIPDLISTGLAVYGDDIQKNINNTWFSYEKDQIVTHEVDDVLAQTNSDNLLDVLKSSQSDMVSVINTQNKLLESQQNILKSISDTLNKNLEIQANILSSMSHTSAVETHKLEVFSQTMPSIVQSLSTLPLIVQDLDILAQNSSIANVIADNQAFTHMNLNSNTYTIAKEQQKQGALSDYELNGIVKDSVGTSQSPAHAKARANAESALSQSQLNEITADDYLDDLDDDFNIFKYVLDLVKAQNLKENNV